MCLTGCRALCRRAGGRRSPGWTGVHSHHVSFASPRPLRGWRADSKALVELNGVSLLAKGLGTVAHGQTPKGLLPGPAPHRHLPAIRGQLPCTARPSPTTTPCGSSSRRRPPARLAPVTWASAARPEPKAPAAQDFPDCCGKLLLGLLSLGVGQRLALQGQLPRGGRCSGYRRRPQSRGLGVGQLASWLGLSQTPASAQSSVTWDKRCPRRSPGGVSGGGVGNQAPCI